MNVVSSNYKSIIDTSFALSPKYKVVIDNVEYLGDVIKEVPKISHSNTKFIGGFPTKNLSMEIYNLNNDLDIEDKEIVVYKGFIINDTIEYVKQGVFIAKADKITTNISKKTITITNAQDRTQLLDDVYESSLDWSNDKTHTGLEIVQEICIKKGITLASNTFNFANYSFKQPNFIETTTNREIISRLAEIGGEIAFFNCDGNLVIKSQTITGDTINKHRYEKLSRENEFKVNTIVLGKDGVTDDIVYPKSITGDRVEFKILDNPFVDLYREEMIEEVASYIIGMSYVPYNLTNVVDGYIYELNDVVQIIDKNNETFNAVILDISNTSRFKSDIKAAVLSTPTTDYNLAGSKKEGLNKVKLEVDHVNNRITALAEEVKDIEVETTLTNEASGSPVVVSDAGPYSLESIEIEGKSYQEFLLPEEYQELEYIETNGTQYINTNLNISNDLKIETHVEVAWTYQDTSIFGTTDETAPNSLGGYLHLTPFNNKFYYGSNNKEGNGGTYSPVIGTQYKIVFNDNGSIIVNDETIATGLTFEPYSSNSLLTMARRGNANNSRYGVFKYFYFKVYSNSTNKLIRDMIPCYRKSDKVVGMYDLVNNKFYTNQGTDSFLYGSVVASEIKNIVGVTNYLPANNGTETINGVTFTKNKDGSITANGTATGGINYYINGLTYAEIPIGTYTFSDGVGASGGENGTTYFIYLDGSPNDNSTVNEPTFTLNTPTQIRGRIVVRSGVTLNNVIFKPMLNKGSKAHKYVTYGRWLEVNDVGRNKFKYDDYISVKDYHNDLIVEDGSIQTTANGNYAYRVLKYTIPKYLIGEEVELSFKGYVSYKGSSSRNRVSITNENSADTRYYGYVDITALEEKDYKIKFTPESNEIYISLYSNLNDTNPTIMYIKDIMLSEEDFDYEPYKENIALVDMNKPNLAKWELGAYNTTSGEKTDSNTTYRTTDFIEIKNSYYKLTQGNKALFVRALLYDKNKQFLQTYTFTNILKITNANAKYFTIQGTADTFGGETDTIKLYEGYEPYYSFAEDDTFKDGLYTQKRAKVILDGTQPIYNRAGSTYNLFCIDLGNSATFTASTEIKPILSSKYGVSSRDKLWGHYEQGFAYGSENDYYQDIIFYSDETKEMTIDEFKQWLSANPIEVEYILATPIEHTLNYEILELHEGYNNITTNDELEPNMEITYLTDSKLNSQYATKSELKVTTNNITSEINSTLKNEYTTIEQSNAIKQELSEETNKVSLEVSKKVSKTDYDTDKGNLQSDLDSKLNEEEFTSANILLKINDDESEAQIKAEKISLKGKEINLTTDNVKITSNNAEIDEEGNMNVIGGTQEEPHFKVYREDNTAEVDITPDSIIMKNTITESNKVMSLDDDGSYDEILRINNYNRQIGIPNGLFNEIYEEENGITSQYIATDSDGIHSSRINAKELIVDNVDVLDLASMITKLGLITKIGIGANASGHFYIRGIIDDSLMYQLNCTSTDLRFQKYENGSWTTIWTK